MTKLNVNLGERSYPIYITTGYEALPECLKSAGAGNRLAIITDSNVNVFQADICQKALEGHGFEIYRYVVEAGEQSKSLDTVRNIYKYLIDRKFDRKSTIVALGGGVVGDLSGFAAATFLRGINFVQVPTSLLAQADSSVGGKVGVDFEGNKNIIGAFYQPKFVYINVDTLKTLPERELKAGMGEVVKHGIIMNPDFFQYIDQNIDKIFSYDPDALQYMSKTNCSIKAGVVEADERESGLRAILNFGHTIGHAIESASNFELLHGECVSIGMVGAFKLARHYGIAEEADVLKVVGLLEKVGLPTRYKNMDVNRVYDLMSYDKKVKNNKLYFILPKDIGEVTELAVEDEGLIKDVLRQLA